MSNYNGRHGPNVSQYLRDLNTISPGDTTGLEEPYVVEDDLAIFTNTQFFDIDSGRNTDFQAQAQPVKTEGKALHSGTASEDVSAAASVIGEMPNLDFMSDFTFQDFNNNTYAAPHMNNFPEQAFQPLQPNHGHVPVPPHHARYHPATPQVGDKRKSESMSQEEAARIAAEEDKRRRNTAASARFRIKKKQREQALEKSAKEMSDKVANLESKVSQLETENKWLKNLLVEKNEGSEDIVALWKEFTKHASQKAKATPAESSSGEKVNDDR
ncbi:basic-leucine zipper transcription factor-like protein [Trichoderma longibrachiatum]|uniref:Basic-leucine zipper transcription factor-like protein n=1 Tax=Trichoderma longibrachiatum ATCC 18648 TaxID=983965 RepID=A0A2T4CCA9_TRILO|nr:basic-leucine zipper transcription factor-like protein [Trichoderma longibrachiatum ATCC 18648]